MSEWRDGIHLIPEHMHEAIIEWIELARIPPALLGSFLRAVLTNNLMDAFGYADEENARAMRGWVTFLYNHAPSQCYGTIETLNAWHERGGMLGKTS